MCVIPLLVCKPQWGGTSGYTGHLLQHLAQCSAHDAGLDYRVNGIVEPGNDIIIVVIANSSLRLLEVQKSKLLVALIVST